MPATLTLTGSIGPGVALTAAVYTGVQYFAINPNTNVVSMEDVDGHITDVAVPAATTVTATKSGTTWTVTIS